MPVVIYIKHGCPYCKKVLEHLEQDPNEDVMIYVADKDFKTSSFKKKYGLDATFPRGYLKKGEKVKLLGGSDQIIGYLEKI